MKERKAKKEGERERVSEWEHALFDDTEEYSRQSFPFSVFSPQLFAFCYIAEKTRYPPTFPLAFLPYKDTCGTRGGEIQEREKGRERSCEVRGGRQPLEDQNRDSMEAKGDPNWNPRLTKFPKVYSLFSLSVYQNQIIIITENLLMKQDTYEKGIFWDISICLIWK